MSLAIPGQSSATDFMQTLRIAHASVLDRPARQTRMINLLGPWRRGRVYLPPTPELGEGGGSLNDFDCSSPNSSRNKRQRRCLIIGFSVILWLLLVSIYIIDVNALWSTLENEWNVSLHSQIHLTMLSVIDGHERSSGHWGCQVQLYKAMGTQP